MQRHGLVIVANVSVAFVTRRGDDDLAGPPDSVQTKICSRGSVVRPAMGAQTDIDYRGFPKRLRHREDPRSRVANGGGKRVNRPTETNVDEENVSIGRDADVGLRWHLAPGSDARDMGAVILGRRKRAGATCDLRRRALVAVGVTRGRRAKEIGLIPKSDDPRAAASVLERIVVESQPDIDDPHDHAGPSVSGSQRRGARVNRIGLDRGQR